MSGLALSAADRRIADAVESIAAELHSLPVFTDAGDAWRRANPGVRVYEGDAEGTFIACVVRPGISAASTEHACGVGPTHRAALLELARRIGVALAARAVNDHAAVGRVVALLTTDGGPL